jgi:3-oxoacyl-[acyl-carrier protein] reductase
MNEERTILVTGGNGGLGRAIGRGFLQHEPGCRVWLGVRSNQTAAEELVAEFPDRCRLIELEVGDPSQWQCAMGRILETSDSLEVLVNNAGLHRDHLLAMMPTEAWSEVMRANLDSVFHGCRTVVVQMMRQRFGRIVNVSSLSALMAPLGQTNYAAAKAGVVAFTRSLAKEVARSGITANAVLPGYIETEALADLDEEARRAAKRVIPMRRFGRFEDLDGPLELLLTDAGAYITGVTLPVDGGHLVRPL